MIDGRCISSAELTEAWDVEAQMGGPHAARAHPGIYNRLLALHREEKERRREACAAARRKREARWKEIAAGEREAASIIDLHRFYEAEEKAA